MRFRLVALLVLGVALVGWYGPSAAFDYMHFASGRSVSAAVVADTSSFLAPSRSACNLLKGQLTSQTCTVYFYNNATARATVSLSQEFNNYTNVGSWTMDSVSTGTTRTSAAKSPQEWAFFNLTFSSSPCTLVTCSQYGNWQLNLTSSTTNVLWLHKEAYNLTVNFN